MEITLALEGANTNRVRDVENDLNIMWKGLETVTLLYYNNSGF